MRIKFREKSGARIPDTCVVHCRGKTSGSHDFCYLDISIGGATIPLLNFQKNDHYIYFSPEILHLTITHRQNINFNPR